MRRWVTADWHLGEDRFALMQRYGFDSAEHMVEELIRQYNSLVEPDDTVYVLGDVAMKGRPEYLKYAAEFNGNKILIRGNHDREHSDSELRKYFDVVIPEGGGHKITLGEDNQQCWMTHYPTQAIPGMFNLVGHIHSSWKVQLNMLNVGVDVNHYRPHDLDKDIPFYRRAITDFYDGDVWVAYNPVNEELWENHQNKGSYFDLKGDK